MGGYTGEQQDALQEAVDRTEKYLGACGLTCAPAKSQLSMPRKRLRGRQPPQTRDPEVGGSEGGRHRDFSGFNAAHSRTAYSK